MILLGEGTGMAGGCVPQGMGLSTCDQIWSERDKHNATAAENRRIRDNFKRDLEKLRKDASGQAELQSIRFQYSEAQKQIQELKDRIKQEKLKVEAAKKDPKLHYKKWKEEEDAGMHGWFDGINLRGFGRNRPPISPTPKKSGWIAGLSDVFKVAEEAKKTAELALRQQPKKHCVCSDTPIVPYDVQANLELQKQMLEARQKAGMHGWFSSFVGEITGTCGDAKSSRDNALRVANIAIQEATAAKTSYENEKTKLEKEKNDKREGLVKLRGDISSLSSQLDLYETQFHNLMQAYDTKVQAEATLAKANADAMKIKLASEQQIKQASASTQPTHITVGLPEQKNNNMMLIWALVLAGAFAFMGRSGGKSKSVVKVKA